MPNVHSGCWRYGRLGEEDKVEKQETRVGAGVACEWVCKEAQSIYLVVDILGGSFVPYPGVQEWP